MKQKEAIKVLSALSHDGRMAIVRSLVQQGPEGMPAGELAEALGIEFTTCSAQLGVLANAEIVGSRREGRKVIYAVRYEQIRSLLSFIMMDCCSGVKEVCSGWEKECC